MPLKTLFDVSSQNFDFYFANEIEKITPQAKEALPKDISFKLFRGAGKFKPTSMSKLGFLGKLFILWKALGKRWWIVVEDEEKGISINQFEELSKKKNKQQKGIEQSNKLVSSGEFILANKELSDALAYLNQLSVSPAYNYISKVKNMPLNKADKWNTEMKYITRFLCFWEGNKKRWSLQNHVSIPEFLVLMYTYSQDKPLVGSIMYKEIFFQAFQSSPGKIKTAFGTLQSKGYLLKTGFSSGAMLEITPLGKSVVNEILTKYAVNC